MNEQVLQSGDDVLGKIVYLLWFLLQREKQKRDLPPCQYDKGLFWVNYEQYQPDDQTLYLLSVMSTDDLAELLIHHLFSSAEVLNEVCIVRCHGHQGIKPPIRLTEHPREYERQSELPKRPAGESWQFAVRLNRARAVQLLDSLLDDWRANKKPSSMVSVSAKKQLESFVAYLRRQSASGVYRIKLDEVELAKTLELPRIDFVPLMVYLQQKHGLGIERFDRDQSVVGGHVQRGAMQAAINLNGRFAIWLARKNSANQIQASQKPNHSYGRFTVFYSKQDIRQSQPRVLLDGEHVTMKSRPRDLCFLTQLIAAKGKTCPFEDLMCALTGAYNEFESSHDELKRAASRLRKRGIKVVSERGVGYRLSE